MQIQAGLFPRDCRQRWGEGLTACPIRIRGVLGACPPSLYCSHCRVRIASESNRSVIRGDRTTTLSTWFCHRGAAQVSPPEAHRLVFDCRSRTTNIRQCLNEGCMQQHVHIAKRWRGLLRRLRLASQHATARRCTAIASAVRSSRCVVDMEVYVVQFCGDRTASHCMDSSNSLYEGASPYTYLLRPSTPSHLFPPPRTSCCFSGRKYRVKFHG